MLSQGWAGASSSYAALVGVIAVQLGLGALAITGLVALNYLSLCLRNSAFAYLNAAFTGGLTPWVGGAATLALLRVSTLGVTVL